MFEHDYSIGESVFIFSEVLNEVIEGIIEGFEGIRRTRVKVLQDTYDGKLRHVVSWVYVFRGEDEAIDALFEYNSLHAKDRKVKYKAGVTVHLKNSDGLIRDREGNPYIYQIIKVYHARDKVSLVNTYGESVGTFHFSELEFCSNEPIFKSSDYSIGQVVSWIDGDDVYEGTISNIRENSVEVSDIRKLLPLNNKRYLPYYKIQSSDSYNKNNNMILTSIVGDNLDSGE